MMPCLWTSCGFNFLQIWRTKDRNPKLTFASFPPRRQKYWRWREAKKTKQNTKQNRPEIWPLNCLILYWRLGLSFSHPPPPPPTTLIPHIEVGFKWMWTQLATPNKMAPVFVDLCAGLVVLLPRQIRRFRHGFFSSAVLDWSLRSCLRVRHLWRQQIADNRRYLRRSFLPWTSSLRSQISLFEALVRLLW